MKSGLPHDTQETVYSVSRLNREVRSLLESGFPLLWLEGEISNLARPSSGHWYFSLKDAKAQVRCAMFRNRNQYLNFRPTDGVQVLVRARISLYEARGEYQLIVEHMEEAGHGALQQAFEALKARLSAEGLFDEACKRPLPEAVRRVGVITSPTGAALRDILSVLRRRFPALEVLIYPVPVQGEGAGARIAAAIGRASDDRRCDALILARGGGSLEDLWAFNEEVVARAIHDCSLPLVCGVGHEIDFTIADFVADVRAPTPSAAAELLSPDQMEMLLSLKRQETTLIQHMQRRLTGAKSTLQGLERRLAQRHPSQRLRQQAQRLDELELRLRLARGHQARRGAERLARLEIRLQGLSPRLRIERLAAREQALRQRLVQLMLTRLERQQGRLQGLGRALQAVSPLATLGRGYAIVRREPSGEVLRSAQGVEAGERVTAQLAEGRLTCEVVSSDTD